RIERSCHGEFCNRFVDATGGKKIAAFGQMAERCVHRCFRSLFLLGAAVIDASNTRCFKLLYILLRQALKAVVISFAEKFSERFERSFKSADDRVALLLLLNLASLRAVLLYDVRVGVAFAHICFGGVPERSDAEGQCERYQESDDG